MLTNYSTTVYVYRFYLGGCDMWHLFPVPAYRASMSLEQEGADMLQYMSHGVKANDFKLAFVVVSAQSTTSSAMCEASMGVPYLLTCRSA